MKPAFLMAVTLITYSSFAATISGLPASAGEPAAKKSVSAVAEPELPDYNAGAWRKVSKVKAIPFLREDIISEHTRHYLLFLTKEKFEAISVYYSANGTKLYAEWYRRETRNDGDQVFVIRGYIRDGDNWKFDAKSREV